MAASLHAVRAMKDDELMQVAQDTAERALRRPVEAWGIADLAVCHGAAGVAQCFHRMYRHTGRAVFADATRCWLRVILEAGTERVDAGGILGGAAGVGLTLLSALLPDLSGWDRPLERQTG